MPKLDVIFTNSDSGGEKFEGASVDWFITSAKKKTKSEAVLSGTNTTRSGLISIDIANVSAFTTQQGKPVLFFNYTLGDTTKNDIQIVLRNDPLVKTEPVKGSGFVPPPVPVIPVIAEEEVVDTVAVPTGFSISENNESKWDWLIWETEGNSDPRFQRGGKTRKLGLYRLNYDLLRKAENGKDGEWKLANKYPLLGGGWVTVAVLDKLDYSKHEELIKTFLPCFEIVDGKVKEPSERSKKTLVVTAAKSDSQDTKLNTYDVEPPFIIMPFNYDDNGGKSRAVGKLLENDLFPKVEAKRLELELTRWATASRSTITAFPKPIPKFWTPADTNAWNLRQGPEKGLEIPPYYPPEWKVQIHGQPDGKTLREFQTDDANKDIKYYSVKTGVEFVSTMSQYENKKDLLEENSIHAMNRSNLIAATIKRLGESRFEARYQIEVLCILLKKDPDTSNRVESSSDGLDNKEKEKPNFKRRIEIALALGKNIDESKKDSEVNLSESVLEKRKAKWNLIEEERKRRQKANNELTETEELRKAETELNDWVKKEWLKVKTETDKENQTRLNELISIIRSENLIKSSTFDEKVSALESDFESFGRNIDSIISDLRSQNSQSVKQRDEDIEKDKNKVGFDGIQIREVSDAAVNDIWFPALSISSHGKAFVEHWAKGQDWKEFWKANYAVPMGRAKGEMLLHFGMQHMTSNSQNFLIAFDRTPGGASGKLKYIILRDIGDTLYNDDVFETLSKVDNLYEKEFEHESKDEFGVTLSSSLGTYAMPLMLRIGVSIVYFFGPFVQGDIAASDDCMHILVDWCIAHNRAFIDYMKEKIGYTEDWNMGEDKVSGELVESLSKYSELDKSNAEEYKNKIVPGVLSLNSTSRWRLIKEFEEKCRNVRSHRIEKGAIGFFSDKDKDLDEAKRLVNAHEVLICAEVQSYIQSEVGKTKLKALHKSSATVAAATSPVEPATTGKFCFKCKTPQTTNSRGWHECNECGLHYCANCIKNMPLPGFISERLRATTVERKCLDQCNGFTQLIRKI